MQSAEQLRDLVGQVADPVLGQTLSSLKMVGNIRAESSGVEVTILLPSHAYSATEALTEKLKESLAQSLDGRPLTIRTEVRVQGKDAGGRIGLNIHNIIAVGSGKGGVGKSTVAAALACGLHTLGSRVGLMDADVYGPSIPHMFGASGQPAAVELENPDGRKIMRMDPIDVEGLKLMSMGFFLEQGQSVVWRGPILHKALVQFLKDTQWGELDYLIIDLPPGTGDVSLTLSQQVGLAGAVVVCTPQQVALLDAIKAVDMYQKVNVPVLGFVENMTGEIFGRGGAKKVAEELKLPFLGEVPINAQIRERCDAGKIMDLLKEEGEAKDALLHICRSVAMEVTRNLVETPPAPKLEIL